MAVLQHAAAKCCFWIIVSLFLGPALSTELSATCTWSSYGHPYPLQTLESGTCPAPDGRQSPWSHPPFCPDPANKNIGGDVPDDCVFTFATFRGNQGISLITSPETAASLASFLDDTSIPVSIRDHPSGTRTAPFWRADQKPFEVRELAGRGKGVVAQRRLAQHETVMAGFPSLLVRHEFLSSERFSESQKRQMLQRAANQLPAETKEEILALARSRGGDPIRDIIKTNALGVEVNDVGHMALFTEGSRVNHNCRPK